MTTSRRRLLLVLAGAVVLLIGTLLVVRRDDPGTDTHTAEPTTTSPAVLPLLGTPGEAPDRAALGVKIDNTDNGRPQTGLGQADVVNAAYAASVRATVAVLQVLNAEIKTLEGQVEAHFGPHPDAEVYLSQPGIGAVLGARVLAEFGDAEGRYADAKSRKKAVHARFIHNDRLVDALHMQASVAILNSPGARAYYDQLRAREISHNAALRQLGNRLVGILHGCLKTSTHYNETTAWSHRSKSLTA